MKKQHFFVHALLLCTAIVSLPWLAPNAQAKYIGGEPPKCPGCACTGCTRPSVAELSNTTSSISRTEGNLTERVSVATVRSSTGPTLDLSVTYNSYNADGSRATVDTVLGYGWTHSYNVFLFGQLGALFRYDGDGRVTRYSLGPGGSFITAPGYFETLTQSGTTFTLTQKDQTKYTFQSVAGTPFLVSGAVYRLTAIVDRNGNTTTLGYSDGNLMSVTDTYGRAITFHYNAQNHIDSITDPLGRVTTFQYDSTGHLLTKITDPMPNSIQYTYDTLYQLTNKVDKDGRTFEYSYSNFLPVAIYDGNGTGPAMLSNPGNWASDATQLAMNQLRVYVPSTTTDTDGRGDVRKYSYDSNGYLTQTVAPDGTTATNTYDPATLQLASMTDANGHTASYQYDSEGNRLQMTDALGHVTKYTYEPAFNMITSMTDPRGRLTQYFYDAHGNRIKEVDAVGTSVQRTTMWSYNSDGTISSTTDRDGNKTTYGYDAVGNRTQITDSVGNVTKMAYDNGDPAHGVGNLTSITDARLNTTSYQYDGVNRLILVTDPTGHTDKIFWVWLLWNDAPGGWV
jgi:YD repeat-containing protein